MLCRRAVRLLFNVGWVHSPRNKELRDILEANKAEYIMEAHSAITAKIAENSGYKIIWANSLDVMSCLHPNECPGGVGWEMLEQMGRVTNVPLIYEAHTGAGNFAALRHLVQRLEARGISGVCVNDQIYPKVKTAPDTISPVELYNLCNVDEFSGKIRAMKDVQRDPNFQVVVRMEGFNNGYGMKELYERAEEYERAGADVLLVTPKDPTGYDAFNFCQNWESETPVLVEAGSVTEAANLTSYSTVALAGIVLQDFGTKAVVAAYQKICKDLKGVDLNFARERRNLIPDVVVEELWGKHSLQLDEHMYFPSGGAKKTASMISKG